MIHDSYCPYRYCQQVFTGDCCESGEAYCREDEHPCDQENGRCRMSIEIEDFLGDPSNLEIMNEEEVNG